MDLRSQTRDELEAQFTGWNQPAYRVTQLLEWLYVHGASSLEAMSNLPKALRQQLARHYTLRPLELVRKQGSKDSTRKFLWRLADHALIESVLIPASPALYGEASDRQTLCISTQVGCAYGCRFCASGLLGFKRNLEVEEIVDQVCAVERVEGTSLPNPSTGVGEARPESEGSHASRMVPEKESASENVGPLSPALSPSGRGEGEAARVGRLSSTTRTVSNLVVMGMGEPLANYERLLKALRILNAPWGGGIGARKITISTSGLAPQIRRLADEETQFRLAVSLHGATDVTRDRIMPVNQKYPLSELAAACEYYQRKRERMITFEYILIAGVNDMLSEVKPLAELARRLNAKVNLIPYNKVADLPWERPVEAAQEAFLKALTSHKVQATLRREKGHDIDAACGQLRLRTERELAADK
jgi:23S rRNA (adenine2503-C2)-methyltransferase